MSFRKGCKQVEPSIGIFDSGIGGLTVLKELCRVLPHEKIIYLGDTARVPYGTKSAETIRRYALEDALFLVKQGIKLLVVACNTASANATAYLKEKLSIPIVEVIGPGARQAAQSTRVGRVGVIGTEATIRSNAYAAEIKRIDPAVEVLSRSCPLFVPLVEENWDTAEDESYLEELKALAARRYLGIFREQGIDTLVLGCTHYPLLKDTIARFMGSDVALVDSARETAREVYSILRQMHLLTDSAAPINPLYFVTDAPDRFMRLGTRFLGTAVEEVKQVEM
jgi:glutamate racemase